MSWVALAIVPVCPRHSTRLHIRLVPNTRREESTPHTKKPAAGCLPNFYHFAFAHFKTFHMVTGFRLRCVYVTCFPYKMNTLGWAFLSGPSFVHDPPFLATVENHHWQIYIFRTIFGHFRILRKYISTSTAHEHDVQWPHITIYHVQNRITFSDGGPGVRDAMENETDGVFAWTYNF